MEEVNNEQLDDEELSSDEDDGQMSQYDSQMSSKQASNTEEIQSMERFIEFMKQKGMVMVQQVPAGKKTSETPKGSATTTATNVKGKQGTNKPGLMEEIDSNSIVTIYKPVVQHQPKINNRNSSSSEDGILNSSDEQIDKLQLDQLTMEKNNQVNTYIVGNLAQIADMTLDAELRDNMVVPHCSNTPMPIQGKEVTILAPPAMMTTTTMVHKTPTRAEQMLRDAEAAKARIYEVPGTFNKQNHDFVMDESYLLVGNNVQDSVRSKIINGEYVDFVKLLPHDRVSMEEDNRMEMINKGGMSYWVPIADRENTSTINGFNKWEQAFRVFSNIYSSQYPEKAGELIQYNRGIHTTLHGTMFTITIESFVFI